MIFSHFVPVRARWHEPWIDQNGDPVPALKDLKHDIGNMLNKAIAAVEEENDALAGVLKNNIDFNAVKGKTKIPDQKWKDLLDHFNQPQFVLVNGNFEFPDLLGAAYEYLIKFFADSAGKKGGEFYTPAEVVCPLVQLTKPEAGNTIYDPTVGSGGFLIQSHQYVEEQGLDPNDLALYGQDSNGTVWSICNALLIDNLNLKEGDYLKRAAILLFHNDPEKWVVGAYIKIGYFSTDADLLYQDDIHGSLFVQAEKAMDLLLTKYLRAAIGYEGIGRVERFPFPKAALREALLNAIVHKDYSGGSPIQISVYENKIYFWNDGQLPDNWTVAQLLSKHASKPFNPLIANAFFRAGMIESWGRGIEKINQECEAAGVPVPEYRTDASGLMVKFHIPVTPSGKMTEKMTEKIIVLLRTDGSLSIAALAEQIGKSASTVERALRKLREAEAIERIGPDKGGHWVVKEGKP